MRSDNIDMLHGPLAGKLLRFTLPIALSSMIQQLFNAADTSIVGYFDSADALAAVGTNTEIVALIVTLSAGLSLGANILLAEHIGRGEHRHIPAIVQTAILLATAAGVCGLMIGQGIARPLLRLIRTPADIFPAAESYLRIYLLGYPFLLLYDFGAAILRARGDSRYPFVALVLSGLANVVLNLLFVLVFHLGVAGVAIATAASTLFSAALVLRRLQKDALFHLSLRHPRPQWGYIAAILKTGIPSAVQGAVFCFANIFVQASINRFGSVAIAGSTIAMNFEYFTYYAITAFGQTATTFESQNYAAGQLHRCRKIFWLCLLLSTLCSLGLIVPIVVFRSFFAGLFSGEEAVTGEACVRILGILLFEPLCNLYEIPAGALRGAGHATLPAAGTMLGTCAFRILWICTAFRTHPSLPWLYRAFPLSWITTILLIALSFVLVRPFAAKPAVTPCAASQKTR